MKEYSIYSFKYPTYEIYFINYIDIKDGVVLNNGKILFFDNLEDCLKYTENNNIYIERGEIDFTDKDPYFIKISDIIKSLENKKDLEKNKKIILTFLNITEDMYYSIGRKFVGKKKRYDIIYKKMTYSSTFLGKGKNYPLTSKEKRMVRKLIRTGLYFLNEQISQF